ncbi:MAG TPA: response regulator [Vicinamibacterales bacterium]
MSNAAARPHGANPQKRGHLAMPAPGKMPPQVEKFPLHALVVDDEPLIRWSVAESLAALGIDVEYAADAASALKMVTTAALPFHLVVMDLRLPDMHDLSLLSTLRQLLPHANLILMTAYGKPEIIDQARALGATVLNKPFELSELNGIVMQWMADPD